MTTLAAIEVRPAYGQVPNSKGDTVTAVWLGEIFEYGILTSATPVDTLRPSVKLFANPGDSSATDFLPAGTIVKYSRLSEMKRVPIENLPFGEWFRVEVNGRYGWVPDQDLMTFAGVYNAAHPDSYFRNLGSRVVVVFSSGQLWRSYSGALTLWVASPSRHEWQLQDLVLNAIDCGLYMRPMIDSTSQGGSQIHMSSIGIDDNEMWGERVVYYVQGLHLVIAARVKVRERSGQD